MKQILGIKNKSCTGCAICSNICPVNAIKMELENGYYQPEIDMSKCIKCNKCDDTCPIINSDNTYLPHCYAAWADDITRFHSSSGGAFSVLAKKIINAGGVVFGAAWSKDFYVEHIYVDNVENLDKLYRSKYAQSKLGDSYSEVKKFLKTDRWVMFVGTPCQVAGLEKYLEETDMRKLILIDFICYYNPSIYLVRRYLNETYGLEKLKKFDFRDKTNGWLSHCTRAEYTDGSVSYEKKVTPFFNGYFNGLYVRKACVNCAFSGLHHHSDITLGDFWKIEEHDKTWNDGRGTSMLIANTLKGRMFIQQTQNDFARIETVPIEWIRKGQANCKQAHPGQAYFYDLLTYKSFDKAVQQSLENKYDVGMVCVQSYKNYGSAFTNFALYKVLKDMKKSVLIITQPLISDIKPENNDNFIVSPFMDFEIAKHYNNQDEMKQLNDRCDTFLVGSDQLFNYEIYKKIDGFIKLNWVDDRHKKICYATSFGTDKILGTLEESINFKNSLSRFSAISIREASGAELVKNNFKIEATQVLDPVFLCNKNHYIELCKNVQVKGRKIFAYVLDPSKEKENALLFLSEKRKQELDVFVDRWMNQEFLDKCWAITCNVNKKNEEWLKALIESEFVFTDSFHGMCMAIIFGKQFIVINNKKRGATRFNSLLDILDLKNRLYNTIEEFIENYSDEDKIDYNRVNKLLEVEKNKGMSWLTNALNGEVY